jgi:hypothetical protein
MCEAHCVAELKRSVAKRMEIAVGSSYIGDTKRVRYNSDRTPHQQAHHLSSVEDGLSPFASGKTALHRQTEAAKSDHRIR